jgi:hypothetical protein
MEEGRKERKEGSKGRKRRKEGEQGLILFSLRNFLEYESCGFAEGV